MNSVDVATSARDLDLNLLRVFWVVAETGSVTEAAARLYLTQPAISAALKRLSTALGAKLFARQGRRLVLTERGQRLAREAGPHLTALLDAVLRPLAFDPQASDRIIRLGLSDTNESMFLPPLLRALRRAAPRMRVVCLPVQFRTVGPAFSSGAIDLAVTVPDELPAGILRTRLFQGGHVALFDPRYANLGARPSRERYLAHDHVIVSYNGDLRGVVEDILQVERRVRISVPSFQSIGPIVEGGPLVATVPAVVAAAIRKHHRSLRVASLPFGFEGAAMELLHRQSQLEDPALALVRAQLETIARKWG